MILTMEGLTTDDPGTPTHGFLCSLLTEGFQPVHQLFVLLLVLLTLLFWFHRLELLKLRILHEWSFHMTFEPPHDKTNKMACASRKDSDQPGHPPSLIRVCCPHEESLGP